MLGHLTRKPADTAPSVLIPWLKESLLNDEDTSETEIQIKLRGNILHVLYESAAQVPAREVLALRLVRSLLQPDARARFASDFSHIYQIYLYSRKVSARKPDWSAPIYLNRLDRHLERLEQWENNRAGSLPEALPVTAQPVVDPSDRSSREPFLKLLPLEPSPSISTLNLARQGDSDAIAHYLGEALSALNVGVKVSARVLPRRADELDADELETGETEANKLETGEIETDRQESIKAEASEFEAGETEPSPTIQPSASRLWILCEASYSPDPLIIAEPLAQRLRQLQLEQFQDAVITIQVTGEAASDWRLRVDLTPPEEMLQLWGRWGDVAALSCLVNQLSKSYGLKLIAEVKKDTLHLISYPISPIDSETGDLLLPLADDCRQKIDVEGLVAAISDRLWALAPRGLQRAMLYGPSTDDISPEWLKSVDLPAISRPDLQEPAKALVAKGDIEALSYCLTRALNPNIREQLATGGIRVQVLSKDKLLHIMVDGPICPPKAVIVPSINQLVGQLQPPDLDGVRLYGRRAGQKQPIWSYGHDYRPRERLVPKATAEFAVADTYAGELITSVSDESLAGDLAVVDETDIKFGPVIKRALQRLLLKSQLFTPLDEGNNLSVNLPSAFQSDGGKMALFWGAAGLLLAVQFDFMVGQALQQAAAPIRTTASDTESDTERTEASEFDDELSRLNWEREPDTSQWSRQTGDGFFSSGRLDGGGFTSSAIDDSELLYSPQQSLVESEVLLAGSTLPSFRSRQLDEKLALYRRKVEQSGPPDVLVIGSSRALRGVDPVALQEALEASGHEDLSVFNFGVNGATAQVVDLVVQRLIAPHQLPQVIVWADGARAFNSGRMDVTFNAIAVSEGYQQLEASDPLDGVDSLALGSLADQLTVRATEIDQELSETFGQISSAYVNRDKVRSALGQGLSAVFPREGLALTDPFRPEIASEFLEQSDEADGLGLTKEASLIDYDGFLPLPNRFNPATYYQDHPRVAGDYDGDYEAFRMDGQQSDALRSLLRFTTEKEIPVVFVNTPLTDEYLDSYRARAEDTFTQYMLQVAERYPDFTFRDLSQLWPQQYDYFSDPSHLNRYGAYQVSQRLSRDPLIPWPQASASTSLLSR